MKLEYKYVPKGVKENSLYRRRLYEGLANDTGLFKAAVHAAKNDLLWWVNSFLWTYDPRKVEANENPHIPFITWTPLQDECLLTLQKNLGRSDILIEKSRDQGASWNCLVPLLHQWQYQPGRAFMVVSRKEELVDSPSNPDSLFWKLDYMLRCQPRFMKPKYTRTKLHLENHENGSYLDGSSTTSDVGRGGRRTAILIDEFAAFEVSDSHAVNAATANNTNCRIFNSTYLGAVGSFYEQSKRTDIVKISLPWWKHPEHSKDLQVIDGKKWSPWYQKMCRRIITPARIAAELDMDPTGSASPFFPAALVDRILEEDVRPAVMRGRLEVHPFDVKVSEWMDDAKGQFHLWMNLEGKLRPNPTEKFVAACDIATGSGASNSVLSVGSRTTREKVLEFATAKMNPADFAQLVVGVCWFFNEAYLIWEKNGPGGMFGNRVVELGYRNIYYMQDEFGLRHKMNDSMVPGWQSTKENKRLVFQQYAAALADKSFINRSAEAIREMRLITYQDDGSVANQLARTTDDPSGAKENHGDRPTADALCAKGLGQKRPDVKTYEEGEIPPNPKRYSFAWRKQEAEKELLNPKDGWMTDPKELMGWQEQPTSSW